MSGKVELLEVLDENGVGTGRPETRDNVHKDGLWHRAIIVAIINNNNEILIQKRAKTKEKISRALGYICCRSCAFWS